MNWRKIFGIIMMLWGGAIIAKWVGGGMPIYEGNPRAFGQNAAIVIAFFMFFYGLYGTVFRSKKKKIDTTPKN